MADRGLPQVRRTCDARILLGVEDVVRRLLLEGLTDCAALTPPKRNGGVSVLSGLA